MKKKKEDVGTKMKLNVKDRLVITELLPNQDNIIGLTIAKDIRQKTEVGQIEATKIGLKIEGTSFIWDDKKEKDKTIEFTDAELELLKSQINELDKQKAIKSNMLSLCLKIREN